MTMAIQTSWLGTRSDQDPPALKINAHEPICTIASGEELNPGYQWLSSTMCRPKRNAQAMVRMSPRPTPDGPPTSSTEPASAAATATSVHHRSLTPKNRSMSGVNTTNKPVMRPELPGLVIRSEEHTS